MSKLIGLFLIILMCAGAYAFDEIPEYEGTIHRPGYGNLQINHEPVNQKAGGGIVYQENALVGTPRAISLQYQSAYAGSDAENLANDFVGSHQAILKNSADHFRPASSKFVLNKFYFINLIQTYDNIDIYASRLGIRATPEGKVFFAGGEIFTDIDINTIPSISAEAASLAAKSGIIFSSETDRINYEKLYILPLIYDDKIEYHLCYLFYIDTANPLADWRVFVDAHDGSVIWREDITRYETISGNVSGMIQPATPFDAQEQHVFPHVDIFADGGEVATTDSDGNYSFDVSGSDPVGMDVLLQGPYMNVDNQTGPDSWIQQDVIPGNIFDVIWNDDNSTIPQHNAFYHGQVVHDFIKNLDPDLTVMDFPMTCRVNVSGSCNAYYSRADRSINFYREGGGCPNIAQIGDVIYHEWGHGLTNQTYYNGGYEDPNGAMHEGFSDILAALITNQPLIGRGFYGPGTHIRTVDNDNRFPDDWNGESHNDGLIISGAVWDLKQLLDPDRPHYVDTLWQYAKYGYSSEFEGYFWDVLTVDDDDGNLDNGTPHAYEIFYSFGVLHGIGPGIPIEIEHTPITDSEDSTVTYPVEVVASSMFSMDQGSVTVYYSTGGDYITLPLTNTSENNWYGEIPRQSFGTTVNYYIEAIDNSNLYAYAPEGAPDEVYSFYVGYDLVPPTMTNIAGPENTINLFGPYGPFTFSAWDVHDIDEASGTLHYKINDGEEMTVAMSYDSDADQFTLTDLDIGEVLQTGDLFNYYFTCRDMALNHNQGRLPDTGFQQFAISTSEIVGDFEDGLGDWMIDGEGWVLYDQQGYQSNSCIKTGDMYYPDNANSIIYSSAPFNFSLFENVQVEFMRRNFLRDGDSVYVVASGNPEGPWTAFGAIGGNQSYWTDYSTRLEGMTGPGNDEVYVGLRFISDESDNYFGLLADQITIRVEGITAINPADENLPHEFSLNQNYPNPFNLSTTISFALPEAAHVTLDIYDLLGRKVKRLVDGELGPGMHRAVWDGHNQSGEIVTSGIYFYRLDNGDRREIKSMTVLK